MLVDHFEKSLHSLLQQRVELWPAVTDPTSEPPHISGMYTLQQAFDNEVSHTSSLNFYVLVLRHLSSPDRFYIIILSTISKMTECSTCRRLLHTFTRRPSRLCMSIGARSG